VRLNNPPLLDPKIPAELYEVQAWFASIITQVMTEEERTPEIAPSGNRLAYDALRYIRRSTQLQAYERIQIYNQNYWWRLWDILADVFPLPLRLFGPSDFQHSLATPYLATYGSRHWNLNLLGDKFCTWLEDNYRDKDRLLVLTAAQIDWACQESFFSVSWPTLQVNHLSEAQREALFIQKLSLQNHLHLFQLPMHMFDFRKELLQETPQYWLEHDFPHLAKEKTYFFVLYRGHNLRIQWEEITQGEFAFLTCLQQGCSLERACAVVEQQNDGLPPEIEENLPAWIQKWILHNWITSAA
jgi:hypothetical protein